MVAYVDQQQPWTIILRAKAKSLDLKFKLSKILSVSKLFRFSVHLELHPYILEIRSKPRSSFSLNPGPLKLKFLRIFRKFQVTRSKNRGIARSWYARKNCLYERSKTCVRLWVLVWAMVVGCFIVLVLSSNFGQGYIWKYVWRARDDAAPSGPFIPIFQRVVIARADL